MSRFHKHDWDFLPEQAFRPRPGGGMTLEGGKGGKAPTPDPAIGQAQKQLADLSTEQWNTFKTQIYPDLKAAQEKQDARADHAAARDDQIADYNMDQAKKANERYEQGAIPAMEKLKADADNYNEAGYREQLGTQAAADINSNFDQQRQATTMRNQSYGVDPTSGVAQGNVQAMAVQQALAAGAAKNQVTQAAKEVGLQKQASVYNMYAGLPAQANANASLALGAGAQGLAAGQTSFANAQGMGSSLNGAAATSMQGWGQVGQLGVSKYNTDVSAYNAQQQAQGAAWQGLGSAVGSIGAAYMTGGASLAAGALKK